MQESLIKLIDQKLKPEPKNNNERSYASTAAGENCKLEAGNKVTTQVAEKLSIDNDVYKK